MTEAEQKAFDELKHRILTLEQQVALLAKSTAPGLQLPKSPYAPALSV